jgi:type IV/VI secretion system ImpK/VasF family protein
MFGLGGNKGPRTRRGGKKAAARRESERGSDDVLQTVIGGVAPARREPAPSSGGSGGGGGKVSRRPRLVDLGIEPLALIHALRHSGASPDPALVRSQWMTQRRTFEEKARTAGHREADLEACIYMLSAFLDATMLAFADARGPWLDAGALQSEFDASGELIAGRRVFERLADLRAAREACIEAVEFYDVCFRLGYRGQYMDDESGIGAVMNEIARDIAAVRGDAVGSIAPNAARRDEQGGEVVKKFPVWVAPAALAAALLLSWLTVALIAFLHARGVAGAIGGY